MSNTPSTAGSGGLDEMLDSFRLISTMLKSAVDELMKDGWSDTQARDIAVAGLVLSMKGTKQS